MERFEFDEGDWVRWAEGEGVEEGERTAVMVCLRKVRLLYVPTTSASNCELSVHCPLTNHCR